MTHPPSDAPETYRGFVHPRELDRLGHLDVAHDVRRFDGASWHVPGMLARTPRERRERRLGGVAREQRLTYEREVIAGALFVVRAGLVAVG